MDHMHGSYDILLVLFSYIVAVVASYTVIDLVGRISTASGKSRWLWLLMGAVAMGMGIWSMHFVGMLAFSLHVTVAYNISLVFLSVVVAIVASFAALYIVGRSKTSYRHLLGGGILLATGIVAMHYIGMAAMVIDIIYDPQLFALSIVIALVAAIAALWLSFYFRHGESRYKHWQKSVSGLIMGAAISGMHYVGMEAASFHIGEKSESALGIILDQKWLAYLITGGTLFTLGLSLLGIFISNRLSRQDIEIKEKSQEINLKNEELRRLNSNLEDLVKERTLELENATKEAIQANLIKSQFLANMSHELRTPLNAIIGYSEMLIEEAEEINEPVMAEDLSKIRKAGNHLLSLINDILDISKVEAGKMELYFEEFELSSLISDIETTVTPLIEGSGNRLQIEAINGAMMTDLTKLRQILINLLSNAGKFTHNGTILLEVAEQHRNGRDGYIFNIKDSGIGMTPEQMNKLFQPFTQADSSTTRKYGGTGLGLAISKRFSQLMDGEISVDSELGKGSTFSCWFPAQPEAVEQVLEESITARSAVLANNSDHIHILLIDDEPSNHQLMQRYLSKHEWTLAFTDSGAEGLKLAEKLQPHVILLDILMPSMDGWSVLAAIKSNPALQDIPVVIWSMTSDKQLGYTLGASEFLTKPLQRERLLQIMHKYIPNQIDHSVLVIEDDEATNELMTRMLQKEGYVTTQAGNGKLALEHMSSRAPDLILLDLMMPEMDGFTFIEEIRKNAAWIEIPVIVITAKTITAEDRQKLNGNVKAIIQKGSMDYKTLMNEVELLISSAIK